MNRTMIDNWNRVVGTEDTVYMLGDFAFRKEVKFAEDCNMQEIFNELNGFKHLIIGNHDRKNKNVLKLGWSSTQHRINVKCEDHRFILDHYPLECWESQEEKDGSSFHLHGHVHSKTIPVIPNRFCASVEVINYTPIPLSYFIPFQQKGLTHHER